MPAPATRPRRLALACALISAVALGTVSASAATASDSPGDDGTSESSPLPEQPREGQPFGLAYEPTKDAPDDVNEANDDFAACMRGEDQTVYPDFRAFKDDDGEIRLDVKMKGGLDDLVDPKTDAAKAFRAALKKCAPLMEEVGITHSDRTDLPDKGDRPGPPNCGDLRKHINPKAGEKRDKGDLPSRVTDFLTA